MATSSMDKALYQAPMGLSELAPQPDMEIEIEDPESVSIHAEGLDIDLKPQKETADDFDANLADYMDDKELALLSSDLIDDFDKDSMDRKDWIKTYVEGLKLLGLKYEERTEPWQGACGVFHPMLTESVVRFQSEGISETFPAMGPVKTKIVGKDTPKAEEAAARVQEDMNYQLTEVMTEYRPEHEKMLWNLPLAGSAFKKVYFDPAKGRQAAVFIPAEDIVVPYGATSLETSERVTHVMRKTKNEVLRLQDAGFYSDVDLGDPGYELDDIEKQKAEEDGMSATQDERFRILEMHVDLDLPGFEHKKKGKPTGIALPYVVTVEKSTGNILAIRRNWYEDDELHLKRQHFVHYQYIPGFGAYGFGLFHLIGGFAKSATSIMRQLVDAGTLSNLPGGLKSRGLRIKGDDTPIQPGEFRDVDIGSGALRDNILPLPYKEPSSVLYQLLGTIVEEGRRFAATADMKVSDMSAQAPVGTTLALLERQLKVMSAVQARLHYSFKQELQLLAGLIRDYTDPEYDYDPDKSNRRAKQEDYNHVDIIPVSDPNAATMSQRVVQYQAVIQMAQMAPDIYDLPQLHRQMLAVLGIKDADKLVPLPDDQKPKDPVSENMAALKMEPLKAFFYQDHESHIKVHMMAMQDPIVMQLIGQNPKAPQIQAAMMAHVAEHVGFAYRQKIEQQLGMPLPPPEEKLPPQIEVALSGMMAQAAQQVLQQNQQQAAQQQAQQQAQDPVLQAQQKELAIREREVNIKEQEVQGKLAIENKKLQIDATAKAGKYQMDKEEQKLKSIENMGKFQMAKKEQQTNSMQRMGDALLRADEQLFKRKETNQRKETPKE